MTTRRIRDFLESIDLTDAHEFATAFVAHVESVDAPLTLVAAAQRWIARGAL